MTHCVFAGGLHDLTEADADALPLVTLVRAQPLLQDGNDLREDLLSQFPHQIPQCPSSNLKPHQKEFYISTFIRKIKKKKTLLTITN